MSDKGPKPDQPALDPNATFVPSSETTAASRERGEPAALDPNVTIVPPAASAKAAAPDPRADPLATAEWSGVLDAMRDRASAGDPDAKTVAAPLVDRIADEVQRTLVPAMQPGEDAEEFFAQTIGARVDESLDDDDDAPASVAANRTTGNSSADARQQTRAVASPLKSTPTSGPAWLARDLEKVITIRSRPVSGDGPFEPSENADYEIVEKLAEGGMGVVYVARQRSLNRELAIKTLKQSQGSGSGGRDSRSGIGTRQMTRAERSRRDMFFSEAVVTANLAHPNIVPIHDLCQTETGMPYYVMKRVHGTPWNKRIRDMGIEENLAVLDRVCDAVAYAHHHGVINRDLKPENVMLGEFGEVMVLDWGLAVPAIHATEVNFQSPNATSGAGTPAYMAPELWVGPMSAIRETADIYLLGAMLFEIVTGFPPHQFAAMPRGGTAIETWKSIDDVLRANVIRETAHSGELIDIAYKAMRSDPDLRHGSVLEFQFSIRNYQRHEESRRLSERATDLIGETGAEPEGYRTFQTASALFEESLRAWPKNVAAIRGLRATRLDYARLAGRKGDYDLALQVAAQDEDAEFQSLSQKFQSARRFRSGLKWTAFAAMLCVVLLGAKSVYDNGVITNLNEEVTVRKSEAQAAIASADVAKAAAVDAQKDADIAVGAAQTAIQQAETAKVEAGRARIEADQATLLASAANAEAAQALADATTSKAAAAQAVAAADAANKEAEAAVAKVAAAEVRETAAIARQAQAETAARVAQVEIQSQAVRSLTLNQNYSDALRELDRLLEGELLPQLPDDVRQQRTLELRAQREQLLRRAKLSEQPVQSQAVSPDGRLLAMGDAGGSLFVSASPGAQLEWPAEHQPVAVLASGVTRICFTGPDSLLFASDRTVYAWQQGPHAPTEFAVHDGPIRGLSVAGTVVISASDSGSVMVHDVRTGALLSSLRVRTTIRDLILLPDAKTFIVAGSRGDQSADVLAWQLPDGTVADQTPERLGQLLMSREHLLPPSRLAVSPDGTLLVISNSRNGDLIALRAATTEASGRNRFPFEHPAELAATGNMTWLIHRHERPVNSLAWSADGQRLLTASDDRTVGVWQRPVVSSENSTITSLERPTELGFVRFLKGHGAKVDEALFLNPEGTHIATVSADRYCRLWDLDSIEEDERRVLRAFQLISSRTPPRPTRYLTCALLPVDELTEPVDHDPEAIVLNADGSALRGAIVDVCFSADGACAATAASDGSLALWNSRNGQRLTATGDTSQFSSDRELFQEGHQFNVSRMTLVDHPQRLLLTAGYDGTLRLWNRAITEGVAGVQQRCLSGLGLVNAFAVSADGTWLATSASVNESNSDAGRGKLVGRLWRIGDILSSPTPTPAFELLTARQSEMTAVAFSPSGSWLATGSRDGTLSIWRVSDAALLINGRAHAKNTIVTALHWVSDRQLLSAGLDGKLLRWTLPDAIDSATDEPALPAAELVAKSAGPIEELSVSPDQSRALTISVQTDRKSSVTTSSLELHRLNKSTELQRVPLARIEGATPERITSARWSPDGTQVLVCADQTIHVLETTDWKTLRVVTTERSGIADAQFEEIGTDGAQPQSITTFDGNAAATWDLTRGVQVARFRGPAAVSSAAFSCDTEHHLLVSGGQCLRIFEARSGHPEFGRLLGRSDELHAARVTCVRNSPIQPDTFASADESGVVVVWKWDDIGKRIHERRRFAMDASPVVVVGVCWSADGRRLLIMAVDGRIAVVTPDDPANSPAAVSTFHVGQDFRPNTADLSVNGCELVIGGQDTRSGESVGIVYQLPSNESATASDASVVPVGSLTPATEGGDLRLLCRFAGHSAGGVTCVRFLPNGPHLMSGGTDGALIIWNWQTPLPGEPPQAYEALRLLADDQAVAHRAALTDLDVDASGRIASSSADGTAVIWRNPLARK